MYVRHVPRDLSRFVRRRLLGNSQPDYWNRRKDALYLREVRRLVTEFGADAQSILDVGSNGCPYLDWFPWAPRRVSIDIANPYTGGGVEGIKADFLGVPLSDRFDVVLCLQVLEHVPDATAFACRLLASTRKHTIVSVPYRWPAGRCVHHIHDPVDEAKLYSWFGREPASSNVIAERNGVQRLVCRYT